MTDNATAPAFSDADALMAVSDQIQRNDDPAYARIMGRILSLGLSQNLLQLLTEGYTVVRGAMTADMVERAKTAILRCVATRRGQRLNAERNLPDDYRGMDYVAYLLFEDDVFQEILLESRTLALLEYLLGESCVLSSMGCHLRGPGGTPLVFHADTSPEPLMADIAMVANCNWALTPYSPEAGALVMIPGSHLRKRQPLPSEGWTADGRSMPEVLAQGLNQDQLDRVAWRAPGNGVSLDLRPGDAVVFHGNTWHGGWRRDIPGLRMNIATFMCRQHVLPQERRGETRFPEVFERHSHDPRFARLLGARVYSGWREEGPDTTGARTGPAGIFD